VATAIENEIAASTAVIEIPEETFDSWMQALYEQKVDP